MDDTGFSKDPKSIGNTILACTGGMIVGAAGLSIIISMNSQPVQFQGKAIVSWFFGIQSAILFFGNWYIRNMYRNALDKMSKGTDPNIDDEEI